jgi:hypothetical protein
MKPNESKFLYGPMVSPVPSATLEAWCKDMIAAGVSWFTDKSYRDEDEHRLTSVMDTTVQAVMMDTTSHCSKDMRRLLWNLHPTKDSMQVIKKNRRKRRVQMLPPRMRSSKKVSYATTPADSERAATRNTRTSNDGA